MEKELHENLTNPYSDETGPAGEKYIEKFQEVLYVHEEPPRSLIETLYDHSEKTILRLQGILSIALERAEESHRAKYEQVLRAIDNRLNSQNL